MANFRNIVISSSGTGGTLVWPTGTLAMGGLILTGAGAINGITLSGTAATFTLATSAAVTLTGPVQVSFSGFGTLDTSISVGKTLTLAAADNYTLTATASGNIYVSGGTDVTPADGGTGVSNNAASTITISGAYALTLTLTGTTAVTLPTTGTLATLAGTEVFTNKTLTSPVLTTPTFTNPTTVAIAVGSLDLGHATDTTIARQSAGVLTVEGSVIPSIQLALRTTNATARVSTTTLADDDVLTMTVGTGTYHVIMGCIYGNESASPGNRTRPVFTGTQTMGAGEVYYHSSGGAVFGGEYPTPGFDASIFTPGYFSSTSQYNGLRMDFIMVVTVSGTLKVQWCQNTSHADDTILLAGSFIKCERLA